MAPPPPPGSHGQPLAELSDEALVARAQGRDTAAFEVLVERHEERIYRLVRRLVPTEAEAQEVLQEALLSAWRHLDKFQGQAQFGSWLYRVATNAALMSLRSARRRPAVPLEDLAPGTLGRLSAGDPTAGASAGSAFGGISDWSKRPDEQLQSTELRQHIQRAVDALPEPQREVFLVRDVEGLSTEDTAAVLGLTEPTVKTRLHRARLALRKSIGDYFDRS